MNLQFTPNGWEDYMHWQKVDRAVLRRINRLIDAVLRDPFGGIGKPEPLKHDLAGLWSRRIDSEHRFVYCVADDTVCILSCRHHYEK